MSRHGAAACALAGTMTVVGEAPWLALGHRFPYTLPGRATLAEAVYRYRVRRAEGRELLARLRNGMSMSVPNTREGASLSFAGCLMGDDERRIEAMYARFLQPGDTFFDVGSHLGFYALTAATLTAPHGAVHVFEAQPWLIPHLERTVAVNGLAGRMHVNHAAVLADDGGTATVYPSRSGANTGAASIMNHAWVDTTAGAEVAGVSLDAYSLRAGIGRIDAMKIDVEGAELGVLRGMKRLFAEMPPRLLMIELMVADDGLDAAAAKGARTAMALMCDAGYAPHEIRPDGRLGRPRVHADLAGLAIANLGFAHKSLRAERPDMFAT